MAESDPEIAVVIPNWNGRDLLPACLQAIRETRGDLSLEVVVVDNASEDDSVALLRAHHADVKIVESPRNEGFACACNRGAAASTAPLLLMLNTDALLQPNALRRLRELLLAKPRAAVVGPQLRYPSGRFQSSHSPFPDLWQEWMIITGLGRLLHGRHFPSRPAEEESGAQRGGWVGGACLLMRREAFDDVGRFDEGYFMYAEEMDLCYRLQRAGWEVWYEPAAVVVHVHAASARRVGSLSEARNYKSRIRYHRLHHGAAQAAVVRALIVGSTAVKGVVHAILRAVTGGRRGRLVVSLRQLRAELRQP